MDGYSLQSKLRRARRQYRISAQAQALFMELVWICNKEQWAREFRCSNGELQSALGGINEKSLKVYRDELLAADLIFYQSGKSKKTVGSYSFDEEKIINYRKIYAQSDSPSDYLNNSPSDYLKGENLTDIYKHKTKTETKLNILPIKKSVNKKNKEDNPFWKNFIDAWFTFYESKFLIKPTFEGPAIKALRSITKNLEKISKEKLEEWNKETAINSFNFFLNEAIKDRWLKNNFLLPIISQKFDMIVNPNKNNNPGFNKPGKILTNKNYSARF